MEIRNKQFFRSGLKFKEEVIKKLVKANVIEADALDRYKITPENKGIDMMFVNSKQGGRSSYSCVILF